MTACASALLKNPAFKQLPVSMHQAFNVLLASAAFANALKGNIILFAPRGSRTKHFLQVEACRA